MQFAAIVEVGQAGQEADEGFLYHVFAERVIVEPLAGEGEQPTFIAGNELFPRLGLAIADALNQQAVAFGGHGKLHGSGDKIGSTLL